MVKVPHQKGATANLAFGLAAWAAVVNVTSIMANSIAVQIRARIAG